VCTENIIRVYHTRSLADFITITPGFRFSLHTQGADAKSQRKPDR
jgi:hypothetical protein